MTFRRPPTAQEAVLAELRRVLGSGELPPGSPIRQEVLAERLGVSRVPIREALRTLEAEGQVVHRPHRGYYVADLSLGDLVEVYRIRDLLEAEAARAAVARLTDRDLAELRLAATRCRQAISNGDLADAIAANRSLHFGLMQACGMPRLMRLITQLWDATDAYRAVYYNDVAHRDRVADDHDAILDAAAAGDAEAVVRLLAEHRGAAVDRLAVLLPA